MSKINTTDVEVLIDSIAAAIGDDTVAGGITPHQIGVNLSSRLTPSEVNLLLRNYKLPIQNWIRLARAVDPNVSTADEAWVDVIDEEIFVPLIEGLTAHLKS